MTYSEQCAAWAAQLRYEDLPDDVIVRTRQRILDVIGLVLSVASGPFGETVRRGALALGAGGGSRLLGHGDRTSPMCAALFDGTLSQALEYDDTHNETIVHSSSPNVAASLALGEACNATGREVLLAVALGNELTCRIGMAAPGQLHKVGFHASGVIGTLGTTFATAKLLGLDAQQMRHAAGISGSQASGILACFEDGTQAKFLHPGWSAASAIAAAHLAAAGYTGPAPVFESRFGIFASHVQDRSYEVRYDRIVAQLGTEWESRNISFKPYPAAHVVHAFLDALLYLYREEGLRASQVERLVCPIADYMVPVVCEPVAQKIKPASDAHGRVSFQYTMAEALCLGRLNVDSYADESLRNPEILDLARRVEYVIDRDAPGRSQYKGWVIAELKDGRKVERIEPHNRGSRANPLSQEDVEQKFRENAARILTAAQTERAICAVNELEAADNLQTLIDACVAVS